MKDGRRLDDGYSAPRKSSEVMYMVPRAGYVEEECKPGYLLGKRSEGKKARPALSGCKCEAGHGLLRIAACKERKGWQELGLLDKSKCCLVNRQSSLPIADSLGRVMRDLACQADGHLSPPGIATTFSSFYLIQLRICAPHQPYNAL